MRSLKARPLSPGPVLRFPAESVYGGQDASRTFTGINVECVILETVQNQMSSLEFFQLVRAPRLFLVPT